MPSNGTTKVRARSRLYDRFSDVSEGPQSGKLGLVTGRSSAHYVLPECLKPYAGARWLKRYPSLKYLLVLR